MRQHPKHPHVQKSHQRDGEGGGTGKKRQHRYRQDSGQEKQQQDDVQPQRTELGSTPSPKRHLRVAATRGRRARQRAWRGFGRCTPHPRLPLSGGSPRPYRQDVGDKGRWRGRAAVTGQRARVCAARPASPPSPLPGAAAATTDDSGHLAFSACSAFVRPPPPLSREQSPRLARASDPAAAADLRIPLGAAGWSWACPGRTQCERQPSTHALPLYTNGALVRRRSVLRHLRALWHAYWCCKARRCFCCLQR